MNCTRSSFARAATRIPTAALQLSAGFFLALVSSPALAGAVDMTTLQPFAGNAAGMPDSWEGTMQHADHIDVHVAGDPVVTPGWGALFAYPTLATGDFTATVKVTDRLLSGKDPWITDASMSVSFFPAGTTYNGAAMEPDRFVSAIVSPMQWNIQDQVSPTNGAIWGDYEGGDSYVWGSDRTVDLRISRIGDVLDVDYSLDGTTYSDWYQTTGVAGLAAALNLGVGTGFDSEVPADVTFSNMTFDALANGNWSGVGGAQDAAVTLPAGLGIAGIDGNVGPGQLQQFYAFHWDGGNFLADASMADADAGDTFIFQLAGADVNWSALLNSEHDFAGSIGGYLAAGDYKIGIFGDVSVDPAFHIGFARPLNAGGVPEPASWVTMVLGFGAVGWSRRSAGHDAAAYFRGGNA